MFLREQAIHVDFDVQTGNFWFLDVFLKHGHKLIFDAASNAQFFVEVAFDHPPHDSHIGRHADSVALQFIEIFHGFGIPVSSDDNFNVFREDPRQPKGDIAFPSIVLVQEIVNPFKNQYYFVIHDIQILDCLIFYSLVADIQPVGKIFPQFFIVQFNFLVDVEFFPEFDEDAVEGVEVVAVVASGGGEVEEDEVVVTVGLEGLVVLEPLDEESLLAHPTVGLDDEGFVVLGWDFHVEPLLDHEVILFEAVAGLVLVEVEDGIGGAG